MTKINLGIENKNSDKLVMVYPTKYEITTGRQENVSSIITGIQTQTSRKSVIKDQLPVAFFSVVGFNGCKTSKNVTEHSGLIIIDIDFKDNPNTDFDVLYATLLWNFHTYACFRSPNKGIKLVFHTDIKDIKHHEAYHQAITEYLLDRYKEITKIDSTGSNVNRACYLPYDPTAYLNPSARIFRVPQEYIDKYLNAHPHKISNGSSSKPLLHVKFLTYEEHYENLKTVVNNWTSMGVRENKTGSSLGKEEGNEKLIYTTDGLGTLVGNNENVSGTLMGNRDIESGTSVGIYDRIFNTYRYNGIEESVMRTNVPLFEILYLKNCTPSKVEWETRIDEIYFKNYPDKRLSTDDFDGLGGLEVCEIKSIGLIEEGKRGKTLTSICTKLIYNNPFCHPALIARELQNINYLYCEDPNPSNPAPDEAEINAIVSTCYQKFIDGELDFTTVLRKKKNYSEISKRKVFCSKFHAKMGIREKQKECIKTYTEAKRNKNLRLYEKAVSALQDGKKITINRIAEYMGMSRKQVGRYRSDGKYKALMEASQIKIDAYNLLINNQKSSKN